MIERAPAIAISSGTRFDNILLSLEMLVSVHG